MKKGWGGNNQVYCYYLIAFALIFFSSFPFPPYVQTENRRKKLNPLFSDLSLSPFSLLSPFFSASPWRLGDLHRFGTSSLLLFSCFLFMESAVSTFLVLHPRISRRLVVLNTLVSDLFVLNVCIVVALL